MGQVEGGVVIGGEGWVGMGAEQRREAGAAAVGAQCNQWLHIAA